VGVVYLTCFKVKKIYKLKCKDLNPDKNKRHSSFIYFIATRSVYGKDYSTGNEKKV